MIDEIQLANLFLDLVRLDSPSRGERQAGDAIIDWLGRLGLTVQEDLAGEAIGGNCGNLLCTIAANWACDGGGPSQQDSPASKDEQAICDDPGKQRANWPALLFSTHLDTVGPCTGKKITLSPDRIFRSDGTTILGADNYAGVAAVLTAVAELKQRGRPHRPLELLFSVGEEIHLQGIAHFDASQLTAREAYVLDTSGAPGRAVIAAPGHRHLQFTVTGQAAHAGIAPEDGVSAITAAARGIAAMRLGRVDSETTANIGEIRGGGATNVVADRCLVSAECRSLDLGKLSFQTAHMQACMEHAAQDLGAEVQTNILTSYLPWRMDPSDPVARRFQAACAAAGLEPEFITTGGGSDLNALTLSGIRGLVLSCGMQNVHSLDEWLALDDLLALVHLLLALVDLEP
jgi:tripeptide aminopeptidase